MISSTSLREKKPRIGTWLSIGSPVIGEIAALSGFEWLLFDLEHGCATDAALFPQLQAIRGTNAASIVRVGTPHPDVILRALDWGADGIMVSHVSTAAEAEACVQAAHYPPRGRRGLSRSVRAYGYGTNRPADVSAIAPPVILAQIETIEGIINAAEIAKVDGIDVLFVGPSDLGLDLKARPKLAPCSFDECLTRVLAAAEKFGKSSGILTRTSTELQTLQKQGFDWLAVDSDIAILRNGFQNILQACRPR